MDNRKIKVLIGDDSAEYGVACANELRRFHRIRSSRSR